ncbi:hypothetical protein [Bacteroides faecium]|uniref:Uncharacterized protein n=1 Tax=Bacteroides faecium TaxID=2715212 RepID=A0A6H0KQ77_9BACE|nr:hypothetical protein [Bacteroides faecium]QIU95616.1 hypothetical protein BacF7301_16315 [Bacteroides faecium]
MGVFERKAYGLSCDVCQKVYINEYLDKSLWWNENSAKEDAENKGCWLIKDEKCYCPACYEIDKDDNVTIKEKKE